MTIDVDRAAQLSKLTIPDGKKCEFEMQMNDIVKMANILREVGEQPIYETDDFARLRQDTVEQSGMTEKGISQNAPSFKNGCFCVPKTVEQQ